MNLEWSDFRYGKDCSCLNRDLKSPKLYAKEAGPMISRIPPQLHTLFKLLLLIPTTMIQSLCENEQELYMPLL